MSKHTLPPGKRAIFFDVNQTLICKQLTFEQCFHRVWGEYTARWDSEHIPTAEEIWTQYMLQWRKHHKSRVPPSQLEELQRSCLQEAMTALTVPVPASFARSFLQEARMLQSASKTLIPGADTALRSLASSYRLAIISNSPRKEIVALLKRFGLADLFPDDRIFTPGSAYEKKPSPHLFRIALGAMKLTSRQAVMVGNSWAHDVVGAARAGMDSVWLQPGIVRNKEAILKQKLGKRKVYVIQSLDQLTELFP